MRFEIRAGGTLAILIGLGLLSGAVFLLGLVAGYEMGQQQENSRQFATVYPLPPPPAESSARSASAANAAPAVATPVSIAASPVSTPKAVAKAESTSVIAPPPAAAPPKPAFVPAATAAPTPAAKPPTVAKATPPQHLERPAYARGEPEITAPARHKGYSVQIEAAMDRNGADAMINKLHRLGFNAYEVQTLIGGETWYRVRVGPYATPEEARNAEAQLHGEYAGSLATH